MAYKKQFAYVAAFLFLTLSACASNNIYPADDKILACKNKLWHQTDLFLGRSINTGGEVSESEWNNFVSKEVAPKFPDGFSVVDAKGYWNNDGKTVHEKSKVLIVLHDGTTASHSKIDMISQNYMDIFNQKFVIGGTSVICPHFYENKSNP